MTVIINHQFTASISFYNVFHGFSLGQGTGTPSFEVNLIYQLVAMKREVLHVIFLDLYNAYVALDR